MFFSIFWTLLVKDSFCISPACKYPIYLKLCSTWSFSIQSGPVPPIIHILVYLPHFLVVAYNFYSMHLYLIQIPPQLFLVHIFQPYTEVKLSLTDNISQSLSRTLTWWHGVHLLNDHIRGMFTHPYIPIISLFFQLHTNI